jgi:cation diffusion facilitator family transporter
MPTSEARVQTQHAGRYLAQLCRHANAVSGRAGQRMHSHAEPAHAHPRMRHVEWSDTAATLDFDQGQCTVRAEPDALALRVEADDADSLRRIEDLIAADLERFGTREHLTITWHSDGDEDSHTHEDDHTHDHTHDDRSHDSGHTHDDGHSHDGGHGHHHGSAGGIRGLWGRIRHALTPHSHDSADRVDTALETSGRGMRTLAWSFLALSLTAVTQLVIVLFTGSVALLGDTIHNFADALTALPVGLAFLLGRRAATRRHTYGLGRAEDLAGVVVVLVITASAALAGYAAVRRLIDPQPVTHLPIVAAAGVIGFAGNELVARWRITVGRRIGSAALVADGLHARTDGFTSLAVVLGAAGMALGIPIADPVIGLAITVAILVVLGDAAKQVFGRLMDAVDPGTIEAVERAAAAVAGVYRVSDVRIRWIGHSLRAELAVTVDAALTVEAAHRIAHDVEQRLIHDVPRLTAAVIHTEPASRAQAAHLAAAHHSRTTAAPTTSPA